MENEPAVRHRTKGGTRNPLRRSVAAFIAVAVAALGVSANATAGGIIGHYGDRDLGGVVYAMTNDPNKNAIRVFIRDKHGRLHPVPHATAWTGGAGAGDNVPNGVDPLGSQNSLVYDADHDLLFAVNAGDDSVTVFDASRFGLWLFRRAVVPSGGNIPVSVAVSEDMLYVLNAGGTASIATFAIGPHGGLTQVDALDLGLTPRATTPPFDNVMAPGQIGVDALARNLIVTHAGGGEVLVAALDDDGLPSGAIVSTASLGIVPFAFDVTPYGSTLVAEAGSGSVSAYDPPVPGMPLNLTAGPVMTGQAATCWIVVQDDGFAYTSNTGSNTLSLFGYTRTGQLTLIDATAATSGGTAPTDMTLANGGGFLYTLDAASGHISGFAVDAGTGALTHVETQGGLPAAAGIQGIAARDF